MDDHSAEGGDFKMPKFNDYMKPRNSFESFGYYERNKRNSMTMPGSCPSTSQNELLKTQVDMFGFGSFEDEDYFSMKTPNIGSDFSMSRENSYQSPTPVHANKPVNVKRARKTTWYGEKSDNNFEQCFE